MGHGPKGTVLNTLCVEDRLKNRNQDEEHEAAECCTDGGGTFLDKVVEIKELHLHVLSSSASRILLKVPVAHSFTAAVAVKLWHGGHGSDTTHLAQLPTSAVV